MRGSVFKRCQCRDSSGKRVRGCRKNHGSWAFTLDAGTDPTGRRKQISRSGFRTREEAQEALTRELAAVNAGTWTDDQGIPLAEWLNQWLDELAGRNRSPKTVAGYRSHVRDVWVPSLGRIRLRDLRRGHVERVLTEMGAERNGDRPTGNVGSFVRRRSPGTLDSYRRTLRAALSVAVRRGLIGVNVAQGRMDSIPEPSRGKDDDVESAIWEPEQTARFLTHVVEVGDPLSSLFEVAAYTGLRRGELCGMRWCDLDPDPDHGGVRIRQTCVELTRNQATSPEDLICPVCGQTHIGRILKSPKSAAGRRWVPLAGPARLALETHRDRQQDDRNMFGSDYQDHDLVFPLPDGTPQRPGNVTRTFTDHVNACHLPVVRLHDMRHGACSLLLAGGVPIDLVQMILGHASPEITRKVYAHLMRQTTTDLVQTATDLLTQHRREQSVSNTGESAASRLRETLD